MTSPVPPAPPAPPTAPPASLGPPPTLEPGLWIQCYRASIHDHNAVPIVLDALAAAGVTGIVWHDFPTSGPDWIAPLIPMARTRGMLVGGSEGLDTSRRTPEQKGASLVAIGQHGVDVVGVDAESAMWQGADADAETVAMGTVIDDGMPYRVVVFDQPWMSSKGHSAFPFSAMGRIRKLRYRAPQFYQEGWKPFLGRRRYVVKWGEWNANWTHREHDVFTPDALKPRIVTVQGDGGSWSDIVPDCVSMFCSQPIVIAWCEPWPGPAFMRAWAARRFLIAHGFLAADCSNGTEVVGTDGIVRNEAVKRFQASAGLAVDGRCGPLTFAAMGL